MTWPSARSLTIALLAATLAPACVGKYKSDFSLVVVNRTANTIQVTANGDALGEVVNGQMGTFTVRAQESNSNSFTGGVAPTPQAEVTLVAKDVRTGAISSARSVTLTKDTPTYVTFASTDFPATTPTFARFTFAPPTPGLNEEVTFSAATSSVSGTGTYAWDFGDGATGTGITITHRYTRATTFTVVLTVTGDTGQTSTASRTLTVSTTLPINAAVFTFSPTVPAVNQDVFFNASTSTVTNGVFTWDFGDGTTGTGMTITHRFTRANTYAVNLRVSNNVGQSATTARNVTVTAGSAQVNASFTFSPATPNVGEDVFFNASGSTPNNGSFNWTFGDGGTGSGLMPSHAYSRANTYTVTLTVTNDVGQSATTSRTFTVGGTTTGTTAAITAGPGR